MRAPKQGNLTVAAYASRLIWLSRPKVPLWAGYRDMIVDHTSRFASLLDLLHDHLLDVNLSILKDDLEPATGPR
jgi:hypothetical protein